jgi:hypothetical protein
MPNPLQLAAIPIANPIEARTDRIHPIMKWIITITTNNLSVPGFDLEEEEAVVEPC